MPRNIVDAADVKPRDKGWTCIVQVIERHPAQKKELTYHPFVKRYRHYLLTDMKGTKIKAVMFDNDIDFFQRNLIPFNRYKISNATVTEQPERYQLADYKYSWTISSKTPVELIVDSKPYTLPCSFDVCRFADLHKDAESDSNIAIRALVVHRFPPVATAQSDFARDYVLINEEEIPIVIGLWKDLMPDYEAVTSSGKNGEPLAIIATNLEVKTFHGLSLATRATTYMLQNPPVPEELDLHKWYASNKEKVAELLKNKAYENNMKFYSHPKPEEAKTLAAAMIVFQNAKTCWIRGQIRVRPSRSPLYDTVCANCQIEVEAGMDWDVQCSNCSVLSPMEIRLKIPVALVEDNLELKTTLRSPDAERICPFTAAEIKKHEEDVIIKPQLSVIDDISVAMDNTEVVCFVKYYDKKGVAENARRYVILRMYIAAEMSAINELGPAIPKHSIAGKMSFTPGCSQEPYAEKQFFSPNSKNILTEIENSSKEVATSCATSSPAKRAISFGSITDQDIAGLQSTCTEENLDKEGETPNKKTKAGQPEI